MTLTRTADDPLFNKVNNLEERLRKVEKHEHPPQSAGIYYRHAVFHMEGPLVLAVSDPDVSASTRRYTKIAAAMTTYGTGTKTVDVLVDGVVVGAVSLSSAAAVADVQILVPALMPLTVETTALGSGGEGLVVVCE